ncbi:subclass B1 metallo-beta-lactamase [Aquimarina pacifica]|uniref:subclass B1 metallo-beta-lactamase n=1 Tax=Aquimarina pacifica TaxID=1296415 RepID=UPI00046FBB2F|nr:subclass B1 metallo-beta-lactamase [Aquimarina pacifica]
MNLVFTIKHFFLAILLSFLTQMIIAQEINVSENLKIMKLSEHSYIHTSTITLDNGATFGCNGFIYRNNDEVYIFDSPANDQALIELIQWLQKELKVTIKGVIFNHFHEDSTRGIAIYKKNGILTIGSKKTAKLLITEKREQPDQIFDTSLTLQLGDKTILNSFFGEAHTQDNIVSYFPDEELLFGGCMLKSLKASKGNIDDANLQEWSNTITKIKQAYPKLKTAIPGHGNYGDSELLDYTISLFAIKK